MLIKSKDARTDENMGLIDRILRFTVGLALLIGGMAVYYTQPHMPVLAGWMLIILAVSVYPLLTSIVGVDPFYKLFNYRSCSATGRNQCGTLPYQLKAAFGKTPEYCEAEDGHSVDACYDGPDERAHHPSWKNDYPPHAKRMIEAEERTSNVRAVKR